MQLSVSEIRDYTLILKDVSEISRRGPTTLLSDKVIFKILGRGIEKTLQKLILKFLLKATIMNKSVETFRKTNAFKLTIILFFWMKHILSLESTPSPPNASLMFICFQHWKRGKGRLPFTTVERRIHNKGKYDGNFHMSQQLLSMILGTCT